MSLSSDHIIEVKNATIAQDGTTILSDVSFTVDKGDFVYLLGRTGSGKSSILKTLYADVNLGGGKASIAGHQLDGIARKQVPELRRKLGIIFQDFELFTDRNVNDNLEFVLKATGWSSSSKIKNRISEVLMRVGLEASGAKMPYQLSGGEQQRVVIARALLNEPHVLLADEPTGNLDPHVADDIMKLFLEINDSGTAILMATHNYTFLDKFPAKKLRCKDGGVVVEGK